MSGCKGREWPAKIIILGSLYGEGVSIHVYDEFRFIVLLQVVDGKVGVDGQSVFRAENGRGISVASGAESTRWWTTVVNSS